MGSAPSKGSAKKAERANTASPSKENAGPNTGGGSFHEKKGSLKSTIGRGGVDRKSEMRSTLKPMKGHRSSFTEDSDISPANMKRTSSITTQPAARTSVVAVCRSTGANNASRGSLQGSTIKVSRSSVADLKEKEGGDSHVGSRSQSALVQKSPRAYDSISGDGISRRSLQMLHQSRQSVITLQDPNSADVKKKLQLEEQIKRERFNKKMKSIVTVQLLRKLLADDPGHKFRASVPSILKEIAGEKLEDMKACLAGVDKGDISKIEELKKICATVNERQASESIFEGDVEKPDIISLNKTTDLSTATSLLFEGRVAFQLFGVSHGDSAYLTSDIPASKHACMLQTDPWALSRSFGSVDAAKYLAETNFATAGASMLGRHLLQLSMVLTNIGNQARVNSIIIIHCRNESLNAVISDLLAHSHYGFLKENVIVVPLPSTPSYKWNESSDNFELSTELPASFFGSGYSMMQLGWPGQGLLTLNGEQRKSYIGPPVVQFLADHGVQILSSFRCNDIGHLVNPASLNIKLLSEISKTINGPVDNTSPNIFVEVTKLGGDVTKQDIFLKNKDGNTCVVSKQRLAAEKSTEFVRKLESEGEVISSCRRWYVPLNILETKILPKLSTLPPILEVVGSYIHPKWNIEDVTMDAEYGLRLAAFDTEQPNVFFNEADDVDLLLTILKEQDAHQDFQNMAVKCNFGNKRPPSNVSFLSSKAHLTVAMGLNDSCSLRALRFAEKLVRLHLDIINLVHVVDAKEYENETMSRCHFDSFKTTNPEVNSKDVMLMKGSNESDVSALCRYTSGIDPDIIAVGTKVTAENVEGCGVVELIKSTKASVLAVTGGIRAKSMVDVAEQISTKGSATKIAYVVDDNFHACHAMVLKLLKPERDHLILLRLSKRSDEPDTTVQHYRALCEAEREAFGSGINPASYLVDKTGDGTTQITKFVEEEHVGLLIVATPFSEGVSDFTKSLLTKANCPVLYLRP